MVSQLEFVRMVDIQAETLTRYTRKGKEKADYEVPMSNSVFRYFYKDTVYNYSEAYGWKLINPENMKEKFMKMVEEMDMFYSYKPVLLKAMLECYDEKGRVPVEDIVDYFIDFYEDRKKKSLIVEKPNSLYCNDDYTRKAVKSNIFSNPFDRFESMRFMKKCQDIEYVKFNEHIWKKLSCEEKVWIDGHCISKLEEYYKRFEK